MNPQGNTGVVAFFQYGGNRLYGATTPDIPLAAGSKAQSVAAPLTGLAPFTTYHYRVVARDGSRYRFGKDRTFKTDRQPLGLTLTASPAVVKPGGVDRAHRQPVRHGQRRPPGACCRPSRSARRRSPTPANRQIVDDGGQLRVPDPRRPGQHAPTRCVLPDKPEIVSPIVFVTVPIKATFKAKNKVRRGKRVKFRGSVSPSLARRAGRDPAALPRRAT